MLVYKAASSASKTYNWGDFQTKDNNINSAIASFESQHKSLTLRVLKAAKSMEGQMPQCHGWQKAAKSMEGQMPQCHGWQKAAKQPKAQTKSIFCFTDSLNFRKVVLPSYKQNRLTKEKPQGYYALKAYIEAKYKTYQKPYLEGDDCLGILQTKLKTPTIIISGDKDMMTIEGLFYDFSHDKLHKITKKDATYYHMYQTLIGDTTDGYKGCPSIGKVKATAILKPCKADPIKMWEAVVKTYEAKGFTEKDALTQAQVACILKKNNYDFKNQKPKLWQPPISLNAKA